MLKLRPFHWLALSFFGFFCTYGVFMPFFPVWLKSQNYAPETIGFIVASAYVFRFIGSMLFTRFIKQAHQLLTALRYLAWMSCAIMLFMSFYVQNFWLLCGGLWLFSLVNSAGIPLSDTLATTWSFQVKNLDYGHIRLIGSCAFIIGVVVFGYFIGLIGESYIGLLVAGLLFVYASLQMLPPSLLPKNQESEKSEEVPSFLSLLKNSITTRILIVVALLQGSHAGYYIYSVIYWQSLGLEVQTTSLLWGLSVAAEVIFFFFSTRLFSAWSLSKLFYLCTFATVLRWGLFPFADTFWEILPIQFMHSVTFALSHYAMMRYIAGQAPNSIANLQGLYNAIAGCAGVALLSVLSGWLYPISATATFLTMAGFALLALPFIPRQIENPNLKKVN